jgi:hypothetical protein
MATSSPAKQQQHPGLVPVQERDFLEQDPPIRGQAYACVSFLSPEDTLASKDAFMFGRFMRSFAKDASDMLGNLAAKFPEAAETIALVRERHVGLWTDAEMQRELRAFNEINGLALGEEFDAANEYRTSMRGFKIRGVYDTVEAVNARAKAVKKFDDKFHVYVAEVGCWCPFAPAPDAIKDSEYAESQLNTLMKHYNESQADTDDAFERRKGDLIHNMDVEREAWLERHKEELAARAAAAASEELAARAAASEAAVVEEDKGEDAEVVQDEYAEDDEQGGVVVVEADTDEVVVFEEEDAVAEAASA